MNTEDGAAQVWKVSELNRMLRELLEASLAPLWVAGEISNLVLHSSGHVYFTLKDARSQVAVVFFRGAAAARQAGLRDGLAVEVHGRLTVYEPRGQYQLVADSLRAKGVGTLQQRFEELKRRLQAEGLFDPERKRPLPALPRVIGVITSPQGAAVRDFLKLLGQRSANCHVRIYPAAVQGEAAAAELRRGIEFFNAAEACDVLVLTRGGGSLEDLWPFNDEALARAVAASAIPVVSAVGHEVDFTICDFVADARAPTPTAAAELVIGRQAEILERLTQLRRRLAAALALELARLRERLQRAAGHPVFREPAHLIRLYQQRVDDLVTRLGRAVGQGLERTRGRLERANGRLTALDPRRVLRRGYAILLAGDGQAVTAAAAVSLGQRLRGVLAEGELDLMVTGKRD